MAFGKWDTGFANYTHLKEKIDASAKLNEHWIFYDIRLAASVGGLSLRVNQKLTKRDSASG
jgi:hypothetical protein